MSDYENGWKLDKGAVELRLKFLEDSQREQMKVLRSVEKGMGDFRAEVQANQRVVKALLVAAGFIGSAIGFVVTWVWRLAHLGSSS